jgi:hypothetical protein
MQHQDGLSILRTGDPEVTTTGAELDVGVLIRKIDGADTPVYRDAVNHAFATNLLRQGSCIFGCIAHVLEMDMAKSSPFLGINGTIDVSEVMQMPGGDNDA